MTQQASQSSTIEDTSSLFRIMIASDNHLGYLENDQIRGDDSFNSFEEILKISKSESVDFLLLGGDLFHHHNPSKKTIIRTGNILQKYVYGQRTHKYEVYCYDPNFKNENLSVEVPIFIIHGNHDDPSGFENFSSIDIFSNKEVNYFGKINNYEKFDLYPILFVKGNTKIALYGIGSIKDERLYLALQNKNVNFHRPDDFKNWFNILIVHQNRFKGHNIGKNKKNYLPESFIPSFFDLVVWGHEHECFTEPVYNSEVGFHVYQPGSSVATSLIQAEAKTKCIGLCEINKDRFRIIPIKLETVRPFIYNQFELRQFADRITNTDDIERIIDEKINEALTEVENGRTKENKIYNDLIPIIRLKIEYTGYAMTRTNTILSKYSGRIANLNDVIQFWKKGEVFSLKKALPGGSDVEMEDMENGDGDIEDEMIDTDEELKKFVTQNIGNYFLEKNKKNFLNTDIFCDYLDKAVNGNEKHSLEILFKQFYDAAIQTTKFDSDVLNTLQPLENAKKDFTDIVEQVINKTDINNAISNGDEADNITLLPKGRKRNSNLMKKNEFKLQSANNFSNEKREDKNNKNVSQSIYNQLDQFGISQLRQQFGNATTNNTTTDSNKNKDKNLLDYLNYQPKLSNKGTNNKISNSSSDDIEIVIDNDNENDLDEFGFPNEKKVKKSTGNQKKRSGKYNIEPKRVNKKKKK